MNLSTLKDAGDLLKTVLSPRPAAAVVVGAALYAVALAFLGSVLSEFAQTISSPVWPLILIGFFVAIAAGSLVVSAASGLAGWITAASAAHSLRTAAGEAQRARLREQSEQSRRTLDAFLRELKPAERSFLDLFAAKSQTASAMESGLLPHEVYMATSHLIKGQVIERLSARTDPPYTERYRLLDPAVALVQTLVLNQPVGAREIVLDLSKVEGSRASGSGARGS